MNFTNRIHSRTSLCVRIRTCTRTRIRTRNVSRIGHSFSIHISLIGGTRVRGRHRIIIIMSMRRSTRSCFTIASRASMTNRVCTHMRIRISVGVQSYVYPYST